MQSAFMTIASERSNHGRKAANSEESKPVSVKKGALARLRDLRACTQVAAVCYRIRRDQVEFLLVNTSGGRWTFPKGCAEPGLTHAQAAALEAFEEAGVHGRIEEAAFTRYLRPASRLRNSAPFFVTVSAHLCEVSRLDSPQEANRNRTWFSPDAATQRLKEGRTEASGAHLATVIRLALSRLKRRQRTDTQTKRFKKTANNVLTPASRSSEKSEVAVFLQGVDLRFTNRQLIAAKSQVQSIDSIKYAKKLRS